MVAREISPRSVVRMACERTCENTKYNKTLLSTTSEKGPSTSLLETKDFDWMFVPALFSSDSPDNETTRNAVEWKENERDPRNRRGRQRKVQ